jgi:DNA-binding protein H-NS
MTRSTFEAMSLNDLWSLHKRVVSILEERLDRERQKLENQLRELTLKFGGTRERRRYSKVPQKFRNPAYPEQTWSGRGKQPHWVKTWIASGANLDDLRVDRTQLVQVGSSALARSIKSVCIIEG